MLITNWHMINTYTMALSVQQINKRWLNKLWYTHYIKILCNLKKGGGVSYVLYWMTSNYRKKEKKNIYNIFVQVTEHTHRICQKEPTSNVSPITSFTHTQNTKYNLKLKINFYLFQKLPPVNWKRLCHRNKVVGR